VWFQLKASHRAVLAITLIGMMVASLMWQCVRDPKIAFLPGDGRAEWILFPSAADMGSHPIVDLDAVFRREFMLDGQPRVARLSVRAAKRVQLKINGKPVDMGTSRNWKDLSSMDVPASLHAGTNTIEARVFNDNGPPALWLYWQPADPSCGATRLGRHHLWVPHGAAPPWPRRREYQAGAIPWPEARKRPPPWPSSGRFGWVLRGYHSPSAWRVGGGSAAPNAERGCGLSAGKRPPC